MGCPSKFNLGDAIAAQPINQQITHTHPAQPGAELDGWEGCNGEIGDEEADGMEAGGERTL
jgi:hypothetical protein